MLMSIDLRTVLLMNAGMVLLLVVALSFLRASELRPTPGLTQWIVASAFMFAALLAFAAKDIAPDTVSVLGGNLLFLLGRACFKLGFDQYQKAPVPARWSFALILLTLPLLIWFSVVESSYRARIILMMLIWAAMSAAGVLTYWRSDTRQFVNRFMLALLFTEFLLITTRLFSALLIPSGAGLIQGTPYENLYIATLMTLIVLSVSIGLVLLISDRVRADFVELSRLDALTGLLSRRALLEACAEEMTRDAQHDHPPTLLLVHMNQFHVINDTHGVLTGDHVLAHAAALLSAMLQPGDLLGRLGDAEFAALLFNTSHAQATDLGERVRHALQMPGPGLPRVQVSIGIGDRQRSDHSVDGLLHRAYQSQRSER